MSSQHQSYITLDSILNDYLMESEQSVNKYVKLFHEGFRGMEDLGLDFFYTIKSIQLPVNANFTVTLPADFSNWTKVGILNGRGGVMPLWNNENLTSYADLLPNRVEKLQNPQLLTDWNTNTWCNFWNGSCYSNVYGVPSGAPFVGSFKIDAPNGVVILNENFYWDNIILEYVSLPQQSETQDYYIPMQFREAMIAWLWWKDKKAVNIAKGQVGIHRSLREEFYNERGKAIAKWRPIRYSEIYQTSQEMTRLAVKS